MSNSKRFRVLQRDNFKCAYCGKVASETALEVDHIMPKSKGGSDEEANLVTACFECNRGKRDKLLLKDNNSLEVSEIENMAIEAFLNQNKFKLKYLYVTNYFLDAVDDEDLELTRKGRSILKGYARKYDEELICECIDIAVIRYLGESPSRWNYDNAINKIGGILHNKTKSED